MRRCTELLSTIIVFIFLIKINLCNSDVLKPKIAIIGAGIGGASTSHFLTELLDGNLEIDIFESNEIGGRLASVKIAGDLYEAGGSIIHPRNKYMKDFVKLLGLEERPTGGDMTAGIWNGAEFVLKESNWRIISMIKLFYRYGIQLLTLYSHVNSIQNSFDGIYKHQEDGESYDNVIDLLSSMNTEFRKLLLLSTVQYFQSLGYSDAIIKELIQATLVVNYGQDIEVHSFVGFVSIAGAGADLWSVKGGNKEVPTHLIYRNSNANVIPSQVKAIRYFRNEESTTQYEISYNKAGSNDVMKNIYDVVVIAAPLTEDQKYSINFIGFPKNHIPKFPGNYQTTVATFIEGDLNRSYFGLEESMAAILSCDKNKTFINSVSKLFPVNGPNGIDSRVWKVFSEKSLTSEQMNSIFSQVDEVQEIKWKAYPKYSTNKRSDKFELYESLYHVNAIEWAASAMEMSAIAGKNVALLIHKKLSSCCNDPTVIDKKKCRYLCKESNLPQGKLNIEL